ncbi:hypothetical protein G6F56_010793 [Rhizopus delemar]|nr:hypothetical protein G6F56_010793 [Rhizopus delemar]
MTFSTIISKENDLTIPTPTLSTEPYPVATLPSTQTMIEITISYDKDKLCVLSKNDTICYYYHPANTVLYDDTQQSALWTLVKRDWHGMTLSSSYHHQAQQQVILSTEEFQFEWAAGELYQWKLIPSGEEYTLNCYHNQRLVAQLDHAKFKCEIAQSNPFKPKNDLITCIIFSGLIVHDHVKSLLKSLGNSPEALKTLLYFNQSQPSEEEEPGDAESLSSSYLRHHYPRDSLAQSFKSIELNPGLWHWWQKIWWSCFPCCMPGGCCDRACVRLKRNNSSRKGWQQHY